MSVAFTPQQREAIDDRAGSALLAANAGSGKTAVMAERCVEAVLHDGVAVGSILALTFTEKAAGELRDRIRRRFVALGEEEHARAVDAGWIGTIHGFCARILRARPLAAGLDPRFDVLDEPAAERLAGEAYERAFEEWARERGAPAIDVAAAYGAGLKDIVLNVHATLRSRGETRPVLRVPPAGPAPDAAALTTARAAAARHLLTAGAGVRLDEGRAALDVCERVLDRRRDSGPDRARGRGAQEGREGARGAAERGLPHRVRRLPPELRRPPRPRGAGGDRGAARALRRALRGGQGAARGARLRGPRARRARPARRRPRGPAALGGALHADHGRRVPGHQPAPARRARGARARQPVRGRRRVPVDLRLPPRRRDDLPRAPRRARRGPRAAADGELPLARGAARRPQRRLRAAVARALRPAAGGQREGARTTAASCGCSTPATPAAPCRASSCSSPTRAGGTRTPGSGSPASRPSRTGGPRRARSPTACARRSTPAGRRATSSCWCARRLRCACSRRRSRSRASRPTWSAGAATGPSSRSATASPTSPRSPTRSTRRRCSASSPRRSAASAPTP